MIIVDNALTERERMGKPIQVGLVGAGFAGKGFALQLLSGLTGMRLVAISNRTLAEAETAVREVRGDTFTAVHSLDELQSAIKRRTVAVTDDAMLLCQSPNIDVNVEATGEIEFAAQVCLKAFAHKKPVVVLNAGLDATLGPILKIHAKRAGAFY